MAPKRKQSRHTVIGQANRTSANDRPGSIGEQARKIVDAHFPSDNFTTSFCAYSNPQAVKYQRSLMMKVQKLALEEDGSLVDGRPLLWLSGLRSFISLLKQHDNFRSEHFSPSPKAEQLAPEEVVKKAKPAKPNIPDIIDFNDQAVVESEEDRMDKIVELAEADARFYNRGNKPKPALATMINYRELLNRLAMSMDTQTKSGKGMAVISPDASTDAAAAPTANSGSVSSAGIILPSFSKFDDIQRDIAYCRDVSRLQFLLKKAKDSLKTICVEVEKVRRELLEGTSKREDKKIAANDKFCLEQSEKAYRAIIAMAREQVASLNAPNKKAKTAA